MNEEGGHTFQPTGRNRKLPDKKPGRHRFIAIASYTLSDESAEAMYRAEGHPVLLDQENLWDLSVGCIDCEMPYDASLRKFCDAVAYEG